MDDVESTADATLHASRALVAVIARSLASALEDVSLPQFRVLVLLSNNGPLRQGVVAEQLGVHASTFSRNAGRLVAGGWVRRLEDPDNGQAKRLELTDAGRALVDQVTEQRRAEIAAVVAAVPAAERPAVLAAFRAFAHAAGEPDPQDLQTLAM
ncbi:MarR family transcriptional regulator [Sediminihabitans luteus]|uniref:MarR family transcriptional regulator n=1 Tax=Sediminihabitans luteus TaxID=1138585 RepID=A0A2M9CQE8_9CELL|nr:MarR family transcriptional regulator [Sediminihabitans luteus]PJJ74152.1 MarR family transcriptional regulator [Sediminihabitans luteus]GII99005.1 transcriptional regulator [Sediminihabitans luteus]